MLTASRRPRSFVHLESRKDCESRESDGGGQFRHAFELADVAERRIAAKPALYTLDL